MTIFRTDVIPSGIILTLAQSMLIRRVRVFTGPVSKRLNVLKISRINKSYKKMIWRANTFDDYKALLYLDVPTRKSN